MSAPTDEAAEPEERCPRCDNNPGRNPWNHCDLCGRGPKGLSEAAQHPDPLVLAREDFDHARQNSVEWLVREERRVERAIGELVQAQQDLTARREMLAGYEALAERLGEPGIITINAEGITIGGGVTPSPDQPAEGWEEGVRQAMTWLRAGYPYGTGPQWREDGAEWIAERLAEETRERAQRREAGT